MGCFTFSLMMIYGEILCKMYLLLLTSDICSYKHLYFTKHGSTIYMKKEND